MTIMSYAVQSMEVEDKRDLRENMIRDKIRLKTSERYTWNRLRRTPPVPQWNAPHPTEAGFFLDFIKPFHKSRLCWELEAEYTTYKGGQIDADPLQRPAVVTFDTNLVEQPTLFDSLGRPITTTAGEFIEGIMERIPLIDYAVRKNLPSDPKWLQTHLGATNKEAIRLRGLNWEPHTLLLASVSAGEIVTENRTQYCEYQLKILADPRTWYIDVWNRGTVELIQIDDPNLIGKKLWIQRPIMIGRAEKRTPVEDPYPLDKQGRAIRSYLNPGENAIRPDELVKLRFQVQPAKSFRDLPLV